MHAIVRGLGRVATWGRERTRFFTPLVVVALIVGTPSGGVGMPSSRFVMGLEPAPQDPRPAAAAFRPAAETAVPSQPPLVLPVVRGLAPVALVAAAPSAALAGGTWIYASWYGPGFYGNRTACGQPFTATSWGVAHRTLPCGTVVQVTYGGQTVSVPVIDRGPYIAGRDLDLAEAVAVAVGLSGVRPIYLVVP